MSQAKLAWAALKNMLRAAARDPLWAFVSLIAAPFRVWKPLLGVLFILIAALFAIGFGGRFFLEQMGFGPGSVPFIALDLFTLLVLAALALERTRIGEYRIENCLTLDNFQKIVDSE